MRTELVERAQAGDRNAFDALATDAYDGLFAIARRILRDSHAAEDAVQEALIKSWRDLRSLRDPCRFDAWMHRLIVNACYDLTRRRRRLEVDVAEIGERPDPTDEYKAVAQRDELERAFLQLSVEQRAVIVLTHYVGMSAADVGQTLGIPTGTVHSRLHYGLRTLRDAMSRARSAAGAAALLEHGG